MSLPELIRWALPRFESTIVRAKMQNPLLDEVDLDIESEVFLVSWQPARRETIAGV